MATVLLVAAAAFYVAGAAITIKASVKFCAFARVRYEQIPSAASLVSIVLLWPIAVLFLGPSDVWRAAFTPGNFFMTRWTEREARRSRVFSCGSSRDA